MTVRNLVSGQYQIGELVFGRGTTVWVETFDAKPYDINAQDGQLGRNDEIYFGADQLKPTTIEITFHVRYNWLLPHYAGAIPGFWDEMPTVDDFAAEWKADEIRQTPDTVKPLYKCGRDGITRIIYGRPGQFTPADNPDFTEAVQCLGEFRRLDTFGYSLKESVVLLNPNATIPGTNGNAPSWFRFLIEGPINHPIWTITGAYNRPDPITIDFNYNIAAGEVVEISSYPWQRRVVNAATPPLNLARKLIGASPYLDRLRFSHDKPVTIAMAGAGTTGATKALVLWRDAYQVV